ncbi:MAG: alpha/beta hydrolase-fold protein [Verrucomicrobiota bacterium]|nr:alpha/beta hydrolase-fold protein [Limisphaera sp.]MDW8381025.1 alpha/beta hydrolase-fold protein [Verrucomicrobiota bacterium]
MKRSPAGGSDTGYKDATKAWLGPAGHGVMRLSGLRMFGKNHCPALWALLHGLAFGIPVAPDKALGQIAAPPSSAQAGASVPTFAPEVKEDRTVRFHLRAPDARSVRLQSSDLQGTGIRELPELQRDSQGVWSCTVGPVPAGAYRYRFLVDGLSVTDPGNPTVSESNDTVWSLVLVPGSEWFDMKPVPHGAVAEVWYWSTTLQRHRRMHVYTPPGYEIGTKHYPVLYLLHGATDSDHSWTSVGRAGLILDNLIAAGRARPMIVVMPHGHTGPFRFGMRFSEEFERDFLTDLLPEVERRYRVRTERRDRAMAGLSMGGMQALNVLMHRPLAFVQVGVFSSGIFGLGGRPGPTTPGSRWDEQHRAVLTNPAVREGFHQLWFATGRDDFVVETSRATVDLFRQHGWPVVYKETDGGHTWNNWRDYLVEFVPLLFR